MSLAAVADLLAETIGLDASIVGMESVGVAARECITHCGAADLDAYVAELKRSPDELQELVEDVVVPETWFFRDTEPFVYLSRHAAAKWLTAPNREAVRILSAPCSTGEEPYSIAMTLREAGLISRQFEIDAVDISRRVLLTAARALYGKNSFRGDDPGFRDRYFEKTENGYRLDPSIARSVRFVQGNMVQPDFFKGARPYDAVFCRNLYIYLNPAARVRLLDALDRLLAPSGILFVGHAEVVPMGTERFEAVSHPGAFAYRRREAVEIKAAPTNGGRIVGLPSGYGIETRLGRGDCVGAHTLRDVHLGRNEE